ncbi:MAG: ATP-binding protein, partial [Actinomycetota bacterium]|nr:ATP-binding protein [Actinomycetota bacterium]
MIGLVELRALIATGETLPVEFKGEERCALGDSDLVQAVVCLANRTGEGDAWLLIGVEDDGRVTGARPRHGTTTAPAKVEALVAGRTRPALSVEAEAVTFDAKPVLVIRIPKASQAISTSDGVFLRRCIGGDGWPACQPMDALGVLSLQADRGLADSSAQTVAGARWTDLDPLEFDRFRRSIRERRLGDESLLDLDDL